MKNVPQPQLTPGATHLLRGSTLNAIIAAIRARTPLDAAQTTSTGHSGIGGGGRPPPMPRRTRYDESKLYVMTPKTLRDLAACLQARLPATVSARDANGWLPDVGSEIPVSGGGAAKAAVMGTSAAELAAFLALIQAATPKGFLRQTTPGGYRMTPAPPRPPRDIQVTLEVQNRWAEAYYCYSDFNGGSYYTQKDWTEHWSNGDIHFTTTANMVGPNLWTPGTSLVSCPASTTVDDRIPGKNYGTKTSTTVFTYSGSLSLGTLLTSASAAVTDDGAPFDAVQRSWREDLTQPTSPSFNSWPTARYTFPGGATTTKVQRNKYRWRVDAEVHVRIQWKEGTTNYDETLAPGDTTSWYNGTIPGTVNTLNTINTVILTPLR